MAIPKNRFTALTAIAAGVVVLTAWIAWLFLSAPSPARLNLVHRYMVNRIVTKWQLHILTVPDNQRAVVDYDTLMEELNYAEQNFARRFFALNPSAFGYKGAFHSLAHANNLVRIPSVELGSPDRQTGVQYLPQHVFSAYSLMMAAMQQSIGKRLFVDSGYRSPGRQAYLFLYYMASTYDYSPTETAKWVTMPGYSEHGNPINTAIDFVTASGINGFSEKQSAAEFQNLEEYRWLMQNAARFNFALSYPENNQSGINFEPWHWHWSGTPEMAGPAPAELLPAD